jgi:hypothetical protein
LRDLGVGFLESVKERGSVRSSHQVDYLGSGTHAPNFRGASGAATGEKFSQDLV